jgi:hypothetical protein
MQDTDHVPLWRALLALEPDDPDAPDPGVPADAMTDEGIPF